MNTNNNRTILAAIAMVVCLFVIGFWTLQSCRGDTGDSADSGNTTEQDGTAGTSPSVSVPVDPSYTPPAPPQTSNVPAGARDVAVAYLTAKENRDAYFQQNVRSWVDSVTPITTPLARQRWDSLNVEGSPGAAWLWAHDAQVKTKLTDMRCVDNPEVRSPQPNKFISIRCTWTAVPVYANELRVPPNLIDFTWDYNGPRGPAVLSMANDGGWKVSMDATGIAQ